MSQQQKKQPKPATKPAKVRKIENPTYKSLRLQKRIKSTGKPVASGYKIMKGNFKHLYTYKRLFLGIAAVYFLSSILLVTGITGGTDYSALKSDISELFSGVTGQLSTGVTLFGLLISSGTGNSAISESGSLLQSILLVIISLTVIWALRQTYARQKVTVKESFYSSMTPLIPFLIVLMIIALQFIPLLIGSTIYTIVISQAIAVTLLERVLWGMFMIGLVTLTIYMICSSVFALYIVTLPGLTPMKALRSARELVRYRRWAVVRKVLFLPLSLLIVAAIIMIPILLFLTVVAQFVFIFLSMAAVIVMHGYMYRLYKELL